MASTKVTPKVQQQGIVYVDRNDFYFYGSQMTTILKGSFSAEAIKDMDVINKERLDALIKTFVDTNKIPPTRLTIILSENVLFIRDFVTPSVPTAPTGEKHGEATASKSSQSPATKPAASEASSVPSAPAPSGIPAQSAPAASSPSVAPASPQQQNSSPVPASAPVPQTPEDPTALAQKYIDAIPFEDVASKTISLPAGVRVIGTNRDLFEALRYGFELCGNIVEAVVPITVFGKTVALTNGFTPVVAQSILHRMDIIRQNNLLVRPVEEHETTEGDNDSAESEKSDKSSNTRTYILLGVMGGLVIILGVLYYVMYMLPAHTPAISTSIASKHVGIIMATTPAANLTQENATSSGMSAAAKSNLAIQIVAALENQQAAALQKNLKTVGYTNVSIKPAATAATRSLVIFASTVPTTVRDEIVTEVKKSSPQVSVQESANPTADVVITLAK